MTYDQPWWLLATLAAVGPVAIWFWARRLGRKVGWFSLLLQCLAVALLAGAMARPRVAVNRGIDRPWLILQDVSDSTRGQSPRKLNWPADMARQEFVFATGVLPRGQSPNTDQTNAAAALRLTAARADQIAGAVIVTDGQFSDADWPAAATALGRSGLETYVVALESPPPDARISDLRAQRRADGSIRLLVAVSANADFRRRLTVRREGASGMLMDESLQLLAGQGAVLSVADNPPPEQAAVYSARLDAADAFPENDAAACTVLPSRPMVAVVGASGRLATALAGLSPRVVEPADAPVDSAGWANYSTVVLADSTGLLLSPASRAALAAYVRDGGGLVFIGSGPHRSPADRDDPLNTVSALIANPFERQPIRLAIVLDASGSMVEPTGLANQIKFDLAREAVLSLQRHLTARDSLAVITYSATPRLLYDSGAARPDFAALREALAGVRPMGTTKVMPALEQAGGLTVPTGSQGVVLLVSDLMTEQYVAADVARVEGLLGAARWRLDVVATPSEADKTPQGTSLGELIRRMNARVLPSENLAGLAEVFAEFLRTSRADAIRHGQFQAKFSPGALGMENLSLPAVGSYILSSPLDGSQVLGTAGTDDPLLARRQVGLGRTVSLALPANEADNAAPVAAPAMFDLLTAAVRWSQRPADDARFSAQVRTSGDGVTVSLDALDDNGPMNLLSLKCVLAGGEGETATVDFVQTAPGRYEAHAAPAWPVRSALAQDSTGRRIWRQGLLQMPPPEYSAIGPNWDNLRRLAQLAGGKITPAAQLDAIARQADRRQMFDAWPVLLAMGLALMLVDWAGARVLRWRMDRP